MILACQTKQCHVACEKYTKRGNIVWMKRILKPVCYARVPSADIVNKYCLAEVVVECGQCSAVYQLIGGHLVNVLFGVVEHRHKKVVHMSS